MSALLLSTQTPPASGFPGCAPNRNRKMQYGKSKTKFQPFVSKPLSADASSASSGGNKESIRSANNFNEPSVGTEDGITRVKVYESASSNEKNPVQVLAELNRLRIESNPSPPVSAQSADISSTKKTTPPNPPPSSQQKEQQQEPAKKSWQKAKPNGSNGLANIYWRAVDVDDLRTHPFFDR